MMTAIQMLQVLGIVVLGTFARAALVLGFIAVLTIPFIAFAYTVQAIETFWAHHGFGHAHHHV